jgi:hypothetical protein
MKTIIFRTLFVFLILLSFIKSYAQKQYVQEHKTDTTQSGLKKNVIYGSLGVFPFWGTLNGNYERLVAERKDKFFKSYWLKFGGGYWISWGVWGPHFMTGLTTLTGSKNSHLELSAGLTVLLDDWDLYYIGPSGTIGYRFQKPGGHFIFRTGIGFPEPIYISLGFSF